MIPTIQLSEEARRFMQRNIPHYMHAGIINYFERRIEPGGFLTSVLANDLMGAVQRADLQNGQLLMQYTQFLSGYVPGRHAGRWGSYEAVHNYLNGEDNDQDTGSETT